MRMYDISQMVVLDEQDQVMGIIDESDILLAVTRDEAAFARPVSEFMTTKLRTIPPTASIDDLLPIFAADLVAIIADDEQFHGIITRSDLINFLRKQLPR